MEGDNFFCGQPGDNAAIRPPEPTHHSEHNLLLGNNGQLDKTYPEQSFRLSSGLDIRLLPA
jgi:hypothetical protein